MKTARWQQEEMENKAMTELKTENVRWDLDVLYQGINDPQIDADTIALVALMKAFHGAYKGKLDAKLGEAIQTLIDIEMLSAKTMVYAHFLNALDTNDTRAKAKIADQARLMSKAHGEYMAFLDIEIAALSPETIERQMSNVVVKKHRPWIDYIRVFKPYMLSEEVEGALAKRSPFGAGAWSQFFQELSADLEIDFRSEKKSLEEMQDLMNESPDMEVRAEAMQATNDALKGMYAKYSAERLYMVAGAAAVERAERGYQHPMQFRNVTNRVPDAVVNALHAAMKDVEGPLVQRFYRLKAIHLDIPKLRWSDRNAPLPFEDTTKVPFDEAMEIVLTAYESFSPTLADLIRTCIHDRRIDAPALKGKQGGAFNHSFVLPGNLPTSWTLLNYLGSTRDVMTVAHELGHAVHGLLAGKAQGPLMSDAPIAYAETASVFGEMVTFDFLRKRLAQKGDTKALLALVMGKMNDMANTGLRQISFSNFERRRNGMDASYTTWSEPKKLSVEELCALWLEVTRELYGDALSYENIDHLWAYIPHFSSPFYVYGYAFGELLTQSLYAKRGEYGDAFEPLYLDLLRAGSTKNALELFKPFGLDPSSPSFWNDGIKNSFGKMLAEAETLSKDMGVSI